MHDLVIRNGVVIDGSGSAGIKTDIAIDGDLIDAIGPCQDVGRIEIDATNLIVAPGFVDVHSHDDLAVLEDPEMNHKISQGVTTDIIGNCGWATVPRSPINDRWLESGILGSKRPPSWKDVGEYRARIDSAHPSCNVAILIGYGAVRRAVLGSSKERPTRKEFREIHRHLSAGMNAGALGVSTGLTYEPGRYSSTEELIRAIEPVSEDKGLYVSHIRDEGSGLVEAVEEAIEIGMKGGCGLHISHHKALGQANWGKVKQSISAIDSARLESLDVTTDVYPYTASSTLLHTVVKGGIGSDEAASVVVASSTYPDSVGRSLLDLGELNGLTFDEMAFRITETDPGTVVVRHGMTEVDVCAAMRHEVAMIGSDGLPSADGRPHPRLYGTFPRVLGRYVRESGVLTLPEAIRKMTSLPAEKFRLDRRGAIRKGWYADLSLFDPKIIIDRATYENPRLLSTGVLHVVVNGDLVVSNGRHLGTRSGYVLNPSS
ncbi:MAG: hypothetical protein CL468_04455 [Acidimicrobiaceae bacterium]|nr:hypothetical protein [Acidimicrobiaceae bacterium]|tara:strand:+ start:6157 stop:7617 length:1461 start_codon:yes stop_codon:yes gene_type:complete